jgi:hypothetical protein
LPAGLYFAAALLAGMLLPILLHQELVRRRWSALLFLGISRDRKSARAGDPLMVSP